jgi:hypothetical protein
MVCERFTSKTTMTIPKIQLSGVFGAVIIKRLHSVLSIAPAPPDFSGQRPQPVVFLIENAMALVFPGLSFKPLVPLFSGSP